MLLPVLKNFEVARGISFTYSFQWNQGVPTSGVPTDLSLYSASLPITNYNGTVTYQTLVSGATVGNSGIFLGGSTYDPTNGIIDIVLIGSDISALPVTNARYKLLMTPTSGGDPIWLMYGVFTVIA